MIQTNSSDNEQGFKGGTGSCCLLNDVRDSLIMLKDISSKVGNTATRFSKLDECTTTVPKSFCTSNENLLIDTLSCISLLRTDDLDKVPVVTDTDLITSLHGPCRGRSKYFMSQFPLRDEKENTDSMDSHHNISDLFKRSEYLMLPYNESNTDDAFTENIYELLGVPIVHATTELLQTPFLSSMEKITTANVMQCVDTCGNTGKMDSGIESWNYKILSPGQFHEKSTKRTNDTNLHEEGAKPMETDLFLNNDGIFGGIKKKATTATEDTHSLLSIILGSKTNIDFDSSALRTGDERTISFNLMEGADLFCCSDDEKLMNGFDAHTTDFFPTCMIDLLQDLQLFENDDLHGVVSCGDYFVNDIDNLNSSHELFCTTNTIWQTRKTYLDVVTLNGNTDRAICPDYMLKNRAVNSSRYDSHF